MTQHQPLQHPFADAPETGQAREVAPGVLWMRMPLPIVIGHVNVYALDDGDGWTLVDTGMNTPRQRELWQTILAGPLAGRPVNRVVVTHHHPDHVGLAGWFQSRGARLVTTRTAWLYARMLTLDVQERPTAESLAFWRRAGMPQPMLDQRAAERPMNFADIVAPLPLGFQRIAQGDVLQAAGRAWTVHCGGGHAPEHATLWSDDGLVLAGDQALPGISSNVGVYATEPEADPLADWIESCTRLGALAGPDHLVLPGHRLPFTGLPQRMAQLVAGHHEGLSRLRDALAQVPRTACELFSVLYRRPIGNAEYGMALVEAMGHLNHLKALGQAVATENEQGALVWHPA